MEKHGTSVALFIGLVVSLGFASVPTDSIGEGSIFGYAPLPTDTVRDTSFHVGDTLWLGDGNFCVKPDPLKREESIYPSVNTDVKIVAGDGFAHGWVTQTFYNPFDLPFNATYVFPMPYNGAVHGMSFTSKLGTFKAVIEEKALAESLFVQAQRQGQQAALLTQTQRSVYTQKLANILPHDSIKVIIKFSMAISYDMGTLELSFPTTIGHRYGEKPLAKRSAAAPTTVSPVYIRPDVRPANSLDFTILICTPFDVKDIKSLNFPCTFCSVNAEAIAKTEGLLSATENLPTDIKAQLVKLSSRDQVPNRDIVIQFKRQAESRDASLLSWNNGSAGYFAMQIYPDLADTNDKPQSIDMVFVIDKSGSMQGQPIELLKRIVLSMLSRATSNDRISLISFDNNFYSLFPEPQQATAENVQQAKTWVSGLKGDGGTEMLKGVRQALAIPLPDGARRIMALITDGGIWGVDSIYNAIKKDGKTTAFAFGVGASPNRDLIDGAASAGNGIGKNIGYSDDIDVVINEFWTRIRMPQLENISINWGGNTPTDLTKDTLGGLWLGQPIVLFGKYTQGGDRTIVLSGTKGGNSFSQSFNVSLCQNNTLMYFVPCMWARQTIENLLYEQTGMGNELNKPEIISISKEFDVLCKYTAFIAIADSSVTDNPALSGKVPLVIPQGTNPNLYEYDRADIAFSIKRSAGIESENPDVMEKLKNARISKVQLIAEPYRGQIQIRISGMAALNAGTMVRIYDVRGRLIRAWPLGELAANGFIWDLTGANGRRIGPGAFVMTLTGGAVKMAIPLVVN
jgi:Ca-activated chloride channel homolog